MDSLEELNDDNYQELSKLKILDTQKKFVLDFQGCVDYRKTYPFLKIYGIKKDQTYIGLTAFARWDSDLSIKEEDRLVWFDEFFLDVKYQHLGYGFDIIKVILKKIQDIYHPKFCVLSVCNDNEGAKHLYRRFGFKDTNYVYLKETDSIEKRDVIGPTDEFVMTYTY